MYSLTETIFCLSLVVLAVIWAVNFILIFPIIFKFFVIPKIEKRIGEKIKYYMSIYIWQIFSTWFGPPVEIGGLVVTQYLIWKIKKRPPGKIWGFNTRSNFAIQRVHYDVTQASRFEIIMCFLSAINMTIFVLMGIAVPIARWYWKI